MEGDDNDGDTFMPSDGLREGERRPRLSLLLYRRSVGMGEAVVEVELEGGKEGKGGGGDC